MKRRPPTSPESLAQKIIAQGIQLHLTPALQRAVREKFAPLLRRNPRLLRVTVRIHSNQMPGQTHLYRVAAQAEIGGPDLHAAAEGEDAYALLDACAAKLAGLLRRRHARRQARRRHPRRIELTAALPKVGPPAGVARSG